MGWNGRSIGGARQVRCSLNCAEAMSLQTATALPGRLIESEGDPAEVRQVPAASRGGPEDRNLRDCRATTVISLVGDEAEVNRALAR
jgi:hypothetical protein